MKKIECKLSEEKMEEIDKICKKEFYTHAEFNRRAVDAYLHCIRNKFESVLNYHSDEKIVEKELKQISKKKV